LTMRGTYSMQSLQAASEVSARTLRHWIRRGLLPRPLGRGRGARYDENHLMRARVVRQLRTERLSLRAVQRRMSGLSEAELRAVLPAPSPQLTVEGLPEPPTAPTYPSVTWETVSLMDGLVLMVNTSRGALLRRVADDIYRHYGIRE